jgi:DNA-binding response OmpR family regulator
VRILLVEDDLVLRGVMQRSLQDAGHEVATAGSVDEADQLWRAHPYDVVLLDLSLPQSAHPLSAAGSGLTVLRSARARGDRTPVLVLTARNRTEERIAGLDAGADDYLGKPFDLGEVEARLRALARRSAGSQEQVSVGRLTLDRPARRFQLDGHPFRLPAREFDVLWELMTPVGRVCSKRELAAKLSDLDDLLADNALEAFISRLRKKLAGSGARIRTLRGLGYVLEPEA